jgi:hypothetical protein
VTVCASRGYPRAQAHSGQRCQSPRAWNVAGVVAGARSEDRPTPKGEFKVTKITENPVYHYDPALHFRGVHVNEKLKLPPGPNNPVGGRVDRSFRRGLSLPKQAPGDTTTIPWTETEIAAAKTKCSEALSPVTLNYEALPPIKEGLCGAPAPILLKSLGQNQVALDSPATVTCALAKALSAWLNETVQPQAKALFSSPAAGTRFSRDDFEARPFRTVKRLRQHARLCDLSAHSPTRLPKHLPASRSVLL